MERADRETSERMENVCVYVCIKEIEREREVNKKEEGWEGRDREAGGREEEEQEAEEEGERGKRRRRGRRRGRGGWGGRRKERELSMLPTLH